jgi:hypothetical protein
MGTLLSGQSVIESFMNKLEIHRRRFLSFVVVAFACLGCSAPRLVTAADHPAVSDGLTALDNTLPPRTRITVSTS